MHLTSPSPREKHPLLQLLILFGFVLAGMIVAAILTLVIGFAVYGSGFLANPQLAVSLEPRNITPLKIQLVLQQLLLFLAPALLLAITAGQRITAFYGLKPVKAGWLGLVLLIMICSAPLMGLINEWNQQMHLPQGLKALENWMRDQEDAAAAVTKAILVTPNIGVLLFNLFVIAVVPAICEELFFRGALQRIMVRMVANAHVGIWISAVVFSVIHFQFFGFLPRLLLGAGFGYLYYWTGSLRYTMFAHFLNNGFAIAVSYYLQVNNLPESSADELSAGYLTGIVSLLLTLALFRYLRRETATATLPPDEYQ